MRRDTGKWGSQDCDYVNGYINSFVCEMEAEAPPPLAALGASGARNLLSLTNLIIVSLGGLAVVCLTVIIVLYRQCIKYKTRQASLKIQNEAQLAEIKERIFDDGYYAAVDENGNQFAEGDPEYEGLYVTVDYQEFVRDQYVYDGVEHQDLYADVAGTSAPKYVDLVM